MKLRKWEGGKGGGEEEEEEEGGKEGERERGGGRGIDLGERRRRKSVTKEKKNVLI